MKTTLILIIMTLGFSSSFAQIGDLKKDGNLLRIFDEKGINTGLYVYLNNGAELSGYNSKYIIVTDGNLARIYDSRGNNTGNYVYLNSGWFVKNVTPAAILVKDGTTTRFYDFRGNYMYFNND